MLLNAANLHFSYGDRPVLRGVDVRLNPGEIVALLGPNGSGKSTLIRVLLGQLSAAGKIDWEAKPLADWRHRELARRVAYLPQQPAWEPGQRVDEALLLGRAPYLQAFGIESARDIEIARDVSRLLNLDELLPRRMEDLSGGQRQRVFLGRCLAQEPAALLLDEPNTHLDLRYQVELGRLLLQLARDRGIGVLMASHELNLAGLFCASVDAAKRWESAGRRIAGRSASAGVTLDGLWSGARPCREAGRAGSGDCSSLVKTENWTSNAVTQLFYP